MSPRKIAEKGVPLTELEIAPMNKLQHSSRGFFVLALVIALVCGLLGTLAVFTIRDRSSALPATNLKTNLLSQANNADRDQLTFSWENNTTSPQTGYDISVYQRKGDQKPLVSTGFIESARQSAVESSKIAHALSDNELYYWSVETTYADNSSAVSSKQSMVTAIGEKWTSTSLIWEEDQTAATLIRTQVDRPRVVEKAILSVTGLDTETSRRYVYNVFVNGKEIGVGPNRRNDNQVFYNSFDVTSHLGEGQNTLGLYSYSQSPNAGILMQLAYFYSDGTSETVYNSAVDADSTQVMDVQPIMFGTNPTSIGTNYYTEFSQDIETSEFPTGWADAGEATDLAEDSRWRTPKVSPLPTDYYLDSSITLNTERLPQRPELVTNNPDGSYTVTFPVEVLGDISLNVNSPQASAINVTYGEELLDGKAKYGMRTGNSYDETWSFAPGTTAFTGFGLKAFRYVTVEGFPGEFSQDNITAYTTTSKTGDLSSWQSDTALLNDISNLVSQTYEYTAADTVADSISRERDPYEGDNLIYQDIALTVGNDPLSGRNTWNYLLNNPSRYTEYRLMPAIGVAADLQYTGDVQYVRSVYDQVKAEIDNTVTFDPNVQLVFTTASEAEGGTFDLMDWPRFELPGYDSDATKYKTIINVFAYESYSAMAQLAHVTGNDEDEAFYSERSGFIKRALYESCFDASQGLFSDGLDANGALIEHFAPQNSYIALAYGVYRDQSMADSLVTSIMASGKQDIGSIYFSYFFYKGLVNSGYSDLAYSLFNRSDEADIRTYFHVLKVLGATISPEAWDPSTKANMTFSHAWGAGGANEMLKFVNGIEPIQNGYSRYAINISTNGPTQTSVERVTPRGTAALDVRRNVNSLVISANVPGNTSACVNIPRLSSQAKVFVDSRKLDVAPEVDFSTGECNTLLSSGLHEIIVRLGPSVNATLQNGIQIAGTDGEFGWAAYESPLSGLHLHSGVEGVSVQISGRHVDGSWTQPAANSLEAGVDNAEIDGLRMALVGEKADGYSIRYRILERDRTWSKWATSGQELVAQSTIVGMDFRIVAAK